MAQVKQSRLIRERNTLRAMIVIYCRGQHQSSGVLCEECEKLFEYAMQRIDKCLFKVDKPTCAQCTIHCYKPAMREQVRLVMRYSGPRMLLYHPLLTMLHYLDSIKVREKKPSPEPRR
jgi:predicted amidophosphoribosyltransferase